MGLVTRDEQARVRERAPIRAAMAGAQVGGVRARVQATTANEQAEGTQARVEVRVSDWTPIRVATVRVQVEGEGMQALAARWMTTATGRLRARVEAWWAVGTARVRVWRCAPIRAATAGAQVEGVGAQAQATSQATTAIGWLGTRVEEWQTVARTRATNQAAEVDGQEARPADAAAMAREQVGVQAFWVYVRRTASSRRLDMTAGPSHPGL